MIVALLDLSARPVVTRLLRLDPQCTGSFTVLWFSFCSSAVSITTAPWSQDIGVGSEPKVAVSYSAAISYQQVRIEVSTWVAIPFAHIPFLVALAFLRLGTEINIFELMKMRVCSIVRTLWHCCALEIL